VERDAHGGDVALDEAATGPNPEEGGGGDDGQSRGGRSALLGKKGGASLPMLLGKKRGAPRSPRPRAAAPPDATADGEEEGSVVVCALVHRRASLCHCRCWRRREERRCRWGRRGECSSCLAADRSPEWQLNDVGPFQVGVVAVGAHDGTGGAPPCLPLLHPCPGATENGRAGGVEREREILDRVDENGRAV
jgi:hypothetical protein